MVLAQPLGKKPRDLAQALIAQADWTRADVRVAEATRGARIHQLPSRDRGGRRRSPTNPARERGPIGRSETGKGSRGRRVRVRRTPPVRCTSATDDRPRSATRSRAARTRPGGPCRASSTTTTAGRRSRIWRRAYRRGSCARHRRCARDPGRRVSRGIHRRDRRTVYARSIRVTAAGRHRPGAGVRGEGPQRRAGLRSEAFGVQFDTYYLESSLYTDGRVDETVKRSARPATRSRARARSGSARRIRRRQRSCHAQERRHVHVFRAGRRVPRDEVAARISRGRSTSRARIITAP